jgi:oligopeptide transport system ATP-binding protein
VSTSNSAQKIRGVTEFNTRPVLVVKDLQVHFPAPRGFFDSTTVIRAVDGVSFDIAEGETLGLVGESGCGKSTTARAILNLVPATAGEVWFQGKQIANLPSPAMLPFRREIQMIFQDPFASLNPRMTVFQIVTEPMKIFKLHDGRQERKLEVMRLLELVGLNPRLMNRYPHEFSGGQRQRIGIARALAVQPKLVVCDEPVSALDVSIQAQVINLLMELQQKLGLSYLFIAHDLAVVRHIATRVGVMYLGRIVELAESVALYDDPRHPYTQALLNAAPIPDPVAERQRKRVPLQGEPPSPDHLYPGCPFVERCPVAEPICGERPPQLEGSDHRVSCFQAKSEDA